MPNCCFNILVIGRIGCGKKMLVNSLLGEDILPPSCLPSNTIISVVKYGCEKQIFAYLNQDYSHKVNDNFTKSINSTLSPSMKKMSANYSITMRMKEYVIELNSIVHRKS